MKKNITLFSFLLTICLAYSQTSNPSFENWTSPLPHAVIEVEGSIGSILYKLCDEFDYNELEDWSSTNQITKGNNLGGFEFVYDTTLATDGTKGLVITTNEVDLIAKTGVALLPPTCTFGSNYTLANVAPGLIVNGNFVIDLQNLVDDIVGSNNLNALNPFNYPGTGHAINYIPDTIFGDYQYFGGFDGVKKDSCIVVSGLKKNGVLIGYAIGRFSDVSSMTSFALAYEHLSCEIPDSIVTVISSSSLDLEIVNGEFVMNSDYTGVDGSKLIIDNLRLDTILPSEFPPLLFDDNATILSNEIATVGVLINDEFCDGNNLTPILFYSGTEGTASINGNNELVFEPLNNFDGVVAVQYYTCNSASICDTATVTITVNPLPVCYANNDTRSLDNNSTDTFDPRLNDVNCGTTVTIIQSPFQGVAVVESNNNITYSPNSGASGVDTLTYQTCSPTVPTQCQIAKVSYNITTVGINEIAPSLISFFPNPAKNVLNISVDVSEIISVSIINTLGEKVYSDNFYHSATILLNKLNNGIYFVEIETNGKKSVRKLQVIK